MRFDLRRLSVMRSVPSAVAGGFRHRQFSIANRKSLHPSATADGTDLITTTRTLIQTASIPGHDVMMLLANMGSLDG
jgi:hypothetical protein